MMKVTCDQCGVDITEEPMVLVESVPAPMDKDSMEGQPFHFCSMAHLAEWIDDQPEEAPDF